MPVLSDPAKALADRLAHPIGTAPLVDLPEGKVPACIVVSDNTRPVPPNAVLLPPILEAIGEHVRRCTVLVALRLHVPLRQDAIQELVGGYLPDFCQVVCHDCTRRQPTCRTSRGLPIAVNKAYVESDLKILTGLVEPHFLAGYSGGRKSICPGIAGRRTIQLLHSPFLLESPRADVCVLEGNPVHEEATEIACAVGADFIVNVAIDGMKCLSNINAGDLEAAWRTFVAHVSQFIAVEIETKADVVITTNGGYPQDRDYYQAIKGLLAASRVVKESGAIILASECRDGLGSRSSRDNLVHLMEIKDPEAYLDYIRVKRHFTLDQWEVEKLIHVLRRTSHLFIYSKGLKKEDAPYTYAERVPPVEEGIVLALSLLGDAAKILVMPQGPYVVPTVRRVPEYSCKLTSKRSDVLPQRKLVSVDCKVESALSPFFMRTITCPASLCFSGTLFTTQTPL